MNKLKNDKLITDFMGAFVEEGQPERMVSVPLGNDVWFVDLTDEQSAKFDSSWDCLMPVVFKILSLKEVFAKERQKVYEAIKPDMAITYNAVVKFIKWYNQEYGKS